MGDVMDDFSEAPMSITEVRGNRQQDCSIWTPRDALIDLLRNIDAGSVKCDALVIAWRDRKDGNSLTCFSLAAPDVVTGLGLLLRAQHLINNGTRIEQ